MSYGIVRLDSEEIGAPCPSRDCMSEEGASLSRETPGLHDLMVAVGEAEILVENCSVIEMGMRYDAETIAIDDAGGDPKSLGTNEADRKRALFIAAAHYQPYADAGRQLRAAQRALNEARANLAEFQDLRRQEREGVMRLLALSGHLDRLP